jgi:chloramphenicol 3-O phosphotransferase
MKKITSIIFLTCIKLIPNNVIFLNGPSSVGKSAIAKELQKQLVEPYLHIGFDWFSQTMPAKMWNNSEGFSYQSKDEKGKKLTKIVAGKEAQKVKNSRAPVVKTLLECGHNLIIDEVVISKESTEKYLNVLEPYNVIFVGLTAPEATLRLREQQRGDRKSGIAVAQSKKIHKNMKYDLFIDTHDAKPTDSAKKIIRALDNHKNRALKKMIRLYEKK